MPGFAQYLDVENAAKLLGNLLPAQVPVADADVWNQLRPAADSLLNAANVLVLAATGSQKKLAQDLVAIATQLVGGINELQSQATAIAALQEGDEKDSKTQAIAPVASTVSGAIRNLSSVTQGFDEKKLKAKRFLFD